MKTAFLFPGQGAQKPGMGQDMANSFSEAKQVFEAADDALGFSLSRLCFEGPAEELRKTAITQPAILTVSTAVHAVVGSRVEASFAAGHSLGEYSALVAAGVLELTDAVRLVHHRGTYMQEAVPDGVGAMAAILGMAPEAVEEVCRGAAEGEIVQPANYNSPMQTVIAGHAAAVSRAVDAAKAAGARKAVLLDVSAPFHCPLMAPAGERLEPELDAESFAEARIPVVTNADAAPVTAGADARDALKRQIPSPVRWQASMEYLAAQGVERFVELGPGKVLCGLLRNIDRSLASANVEDSAGVEKLNA